jgi:hypothetical protein
LRWNKVVYFSMLGLGITFLILSSVLWYVHNSYK